MPRILELVALFLSLKLTILTRDPEAGPHACRDHLQGVGDTFVSVYHLAGR